MAQGRKTGGRVAGTPNKATAELKTFLDGVFEEAFADDGFRAQLLRSITSLSIDTKLFVTLLAYYAGAPPKAVDHTHSGTVTLESIIAGTVAAEEPDPDDEKGLET